MLVEDNSFIKSLHSQILRQITKHDVLVAKDGKEALRMLNQQPIQLLVTDLFMPDMNGLELVKKIRCNETRSASNMSILIISDYPVRTILQSCTQLDINGFLAKPISKKQAEVRVIQALAVNNPVKAVDGYQAVETDLEKLKQLDKAAFGEASAAVSDGLANQEEGLMDVEDDEDIEVEVESNEPKVSGE